MRIYHSAPAAARPPPGALLCSVESDDMSVRSLSALLVAIVAFATAWAVVLRDRKRRTFRHFAALCFNLCFYDLAEFLESAASEPRSAWVVWLPAFFAVAIPL